LSTFQCYIKKKNKEIVDCVGCLVDVVWLYAVLMICDSVLTGKKKKKGGKKGSDSLVIDKSYLSCGHHHAMVAGLAFLPQRGQLFTLTLLSRPKRLHPKLHVQVDPVTAAPACNLYPLKGVCNKSAAAYDRR
jgi:hypothetical protein